MQFQQRMSYTTKKHSSVRQIQMCLKYHAKTSQIFNVGTHTTHHLLCTMLNTILSVLIMKFFCTAYHMPQIIFQMKQIEKNCATKLSDIAEGSGSSI